MSDETVNVRYMVDDVASAVDFYTKHLGLTEQMSNVRFRNDVVTGPGSQILIEDPAGNWIELRQPAG